MSSVTEDEILECDMNRRIRIRSANIIVFRTAKYYRDEVRSHNGSRSAVILSNLAQVDIERIVYGLVPEVDSFVAQLNPQIWVGFPRIAPHVEVHRHCRKGSTKEDTIIHVKCLNKVDRRR